jgi:hypothetical protein
MNSKITKTIKLTIINGDNKTKMKECVVIDSSNNKNIVEKNNCDVSILENCDFSIRHYYIFCLVTFISLGFISTIYIFYVLHI